MGSDNLFHKAREQNSRALKRKKASKKPSTKILIVCEDSKSSAYYLQELVRDIGLSSVVIEGKRCGSAPISVLEFAKKEYKNSQLEKDPYDKVYCVFDRDKHDSYDITINNIRTIKPKNVFSAITTTPCFEFWLLLHYCYTSASFPSQRNKSPCDCANAALTTKERFPDYGKNLNQIYNRTKNLLPTAIANAEQLARENLTTESTDPQTNMHELIKHLQLVQR